MRALATGPCCRPKNASRRDYVPLRHRRTDSRDSSRNRRDSRTIVSGYLVDKASEDEDFLQVARYMLEFVTMDKPDFLEHLMAALSAFLQDQLTRRERLNWS